MKAERRHELKHNELADWLGERMEMVKPHTTGILLGLALLAAIVLATAFYFSGETHAAATAWSSYFDAFNDRDPQRVLQDLATKQSGSKAAWWAQAALGDMNLSEGTSLLYSDRKEAQKRLEAAEAAYKQVERADDPMLKNRALLGLARVYESTFKPDEARKYYEQVAASEKDSPLGKQAAADAKRLKDSRELAFLDWFATQTPKRPAPFPGVGANVPNLPSDLPDRPNLELPKSLGLDNIGTGAPAEPPPAFPAPLGASPAAATTDAVPADATKAGEAKPADAAAPQAPAPDAAKPDESGAGEKSSEKKSD
ncbi:MAG TPA: tetratricopeptide repeat protein [Pirellulaceae bacterium]